MRHIRISGEKSLPMPEYDWLYGTRKDKVDVVWPITGRGHSQ
jgi:hypothetical protein